MVKIIADSTCDLSDATLKKYDIDMLPLYIHMGENEYKDRLEVTVEDIFKWSDQYNTTPKTSAPSIEDAQNAIIPYMEKNADIIMFAISEDMSTTANVMRLAADNLEYEDHVFVINSESLSTGIGLSLVHNLVEMMHGKIEVDTALGQGSTFTVSLPLRAEAYRNDQNVEFILDDGSRDVSSEVQMPEELEDQKDITILVVEDNDELRHFIVHILQKEYRVLEAPNGRIGLEKVLAEMPDVVVSDVMMPEMDGIELLNAVKTNHNVCHIPVIILSAKASLDDRIKGLEYGADGYITKPFSSAYLRARLKSVLLQRTHLKDFLLAGRSLDEVTVTATEEKQEHRLEDLSPSLPQITHFDEEFIKNIIQSVEDNLNNPDFKIEDLADSMGMGRSMFYRKIKSILSVSPIDFVKDMRVKRSVQLLESLSCG